MDINEDMPNSFKIHEKGYNNWKEDNYPGIKDSTRWFLSNILDINRKYSLWKNQREAVLRTIYGFEILKEDTIKINDPLLKIVTGGGKTLIIAIIIAWLLISHDIKKFLITTPNTIVRDRIKDEFVKPKEKEIAENWESIFIKYQLLPKEIAYKYIKDLGACVLEPGSSPTSMLESGIIICNSQQLYHKGKSIGKNYDYIMRNIDKLCIINDEAHNTCAPEYAEILSDFSEKYVFRLDTTATPTRADGKYPTTKMIYDYDVPEALTDKIIKGITIFEPNVNLEEIIYVNYETGEKRNITKIDQQEWDKAEKGIKPFQWILDDEPMRKQISFALDRLKRHELIAKDRYNPLLFIVTMTKKEGERVKNILINEFKIPTLLVTEDTSDQYKDIARTLGKNKKQTAYKAIVSVMLLREGWDVPQVSVILLLRKFSSPVYGQQVIGRGLRRIILEDEVENLSVIDHHILGHDWLWKKFFPSARKARDINDDGQQDFQGHSRIRDELKNRINDQNRMKKINILKEQDFLKVAYADKLVVLEIEDRYVEKNWRTILDSTEYVMPEGVIIEKTNYYEWEGTHIDQKKEKEIISGTIDNLNRPRFEIEDSTEEELREDLKKEVYELCFLKASDYGCTFLTSYLYDIMMDHISKKIFKGKSIYDAEIIYIKFAHGRLKKDILANFSEAILLGILYEEEKDIGLEEVI